MDVEKVCKIIRELIALNESSARLAREVMVAQEVADELEHAAELALEELRSGRPEDARRTSDRALDDAVAVFRSADSAHAEEMIVSTGYAAHLERSQRVMEMARRLVAELEPVTGDAAGGELRSERRAPSGPRTERRKAPGVTREAAGRSQLS